MLEAVFREVCSGGAWRILVVIDSEGRLPREAVENDIVWQVRRHRERFSVIAAVPRHEAWLCIGLGGDWGGCRSRPEGFLSRYAGRPYDCKTKHLLAGLARGMDVCRLIGEEGFVEYLAGLCWLLGDRGAFCKELAGHGRAGRPASPSLCDVCYPGLCTALCLAVAVLVPARCCFMGVSWARLLGAGLDSCPVAVPSSRCGV